jgi:2-oxoglutarate dehydrogenase E1 component
LELSTQKFSYLKSANAGYIDETLSRYRADPSSVDPTWRYFFEGMELGEATASTPSANLMSEAQVYELIEAYREFGRLLANINPLFPPPPSHPYLELSRFGLSEANLGNTYQAGNFLGIGPAALGSIISRLKQIYCSNVAIECNYIQNIEERDWIQNKIESVTGFVQPLDPPTKKFILKRVTESETFERFLHTRYVAQKRFSIEGGEATIPGLDCMIETAAVSGAKEIILGMAHRGRINVLTNLMGKKPEFVLTEFEGTYDPLKLVGESDVKYHMGYSADLTTRQGRQIHLSLAFNPSHLEFVGPVVEGMARAKQCFTDDQDRSQVIPILIHGDAAFSGQGVCYETVQMSTLPGYQTGGTIHIVINNQVGFTTSPKDARSTTYCTDMAKMLNVPIFHVNGDDPEAMWNVSKFCIEYRQRFKKDAFIDLVCYRKHGHNEGDEPTFTQPVLYQAIKAHPSPRDVYASKLISEGVVQEAEPQAWVEELNAKYTEAQNRTRAEKPQPFVSSFERRWKGLKSATHEDMFKAVDTAVSDSTLKDLAQKLNTVPSGFHLHPKLGRFLEARLKAVQESKGIDWGNGETLAYATLVSEGTPVRLSGQDVERGTFTHRHSVLNDYETGEAYVPLNHVASKQATYSVFNSFLSETGVMGFDYGFSLADPKTLVIWEAQFGDFANGAQVIIDQFLAAGESKWQRMSGLVLLLPHGYEGQAAEHSSAKLERFLQLCGRDNMNVCNFTTPAQIFHALRRQVKRDFRKPLIVMSPKSLLRHPLAVSTLDEFSGAGFQEVLDDATVASDAIAQAVKNVLLCSGKVYYDLITEKTTKNLGETAVIRVEQLYPFPAQKIAAILGRYKSAKLAWVQEEPRNMGAWTYIFGQWLGGYDRFADSVGGRGIDYVGREVGAAPAVGSAKLHEKEQKSIIERAFSPALMK